MAILLWLLVAWDARVALAPAPAPTSTGGDRGDRYLLAAAVVFGLAIGNHSLTLLLAIPVGLYVLAVDPAIWRRRRLVARLRRRCSWRPSSLVYLELPLRAGPFRAPLVYGTPEHLGRLPVHRPRRAVPGQPRSTRSASCRASSASWSTRTVSQFGILAPLIPLAFIATACAGRAYALLTGTAAAITCFFAASYVNADISRYYLGPALMAWTWLAILGGGRGRRSWPASAGPSRRPTPPGRARPTPPAAESRTRGSILIASVLADRAPRADPASTSRRASRRRRAAQREAAQWADHVARRHGARRGDRQLVELLDPAVVRAAASRASARTSTIIDDRTRLDQNLGGLTDVIDANLGEAPRLRHPARPARGGPPRRALRPRLHRWRDARSLTRVIGLKAACAPGGPARRVRRPSSSGPRPRRRRRAS